MNYCDVRLRRSHYRGWLERTMLDVHTGGDVQLIRESNCIVHRTASVNPDWWQHMQLDPDYTMSVNKASRAVDKAIAGQLLGVRECRIVIRILDHIEAERCDNIEAARRELYQRRVNRYSHKLRLWAHRKLSLDFSNQLARIIVGTVK